MTGAFSERVAEALAASGVSSRVVITHNRVRMLSAQRVNGEVHVRVAARLAALGDEAVAAVAGWVTGERGAPRRVRTLLARAGRAEPAQGPPRRVVIQTAGEVHDLERIAEAERASRWPGTAPNVPVTWGARSAARRSQRSVRLGSYDFKREVVRIHRLLDTAVVPAWFIGFVVFHELLHAELGAELRGRRRQVHTPTFRRREAEHPRYADALAWEAEHLPRLLAGVG